MAFMALWEERLGAVLALPNPKTDGGVATHATLFRTVTRQSRCLLVLLLLQVSCCQATMQRKDTLEHFSIHIYIYTDRLGLWRAPFSWEKRFCLTGHFVRGCAALVFPTLDLFVCKEGPPSDVGVVEAERLARLDWLASVCGNGTKLQLHLEFFPADTQRFLSR